MSRKIRVSETTKATIVSSLTLVSATADILSDKAPKLIGKTFDLASNVVDMAIRATEHSTIDKLEDEYEEIELREKIELKRSKSKVETQTETAK